jgi:hypothetical protein
MRAPFGFNELPLFLMLMLVLVLELPGTHCSRPALSGRIAVSNTAT